MSVRLFTSDILFSQRILACAGFTMGRLTENGKLLWTRRRRNFLVSLKKEGEILVGLTRGQKETSGYKSKARFLGQKPFSV